VEKWKNLTEGLEDDAEGLAKIYWDELFAKLDAETYGSNDPSHSSERMIMEMHPNG
jgi:hypothetical protein